MYLTKNGVKTYTWNSADQVCVGDTRPTMEGVFGTSLNWGDFSFSANFRYSFGGQVYNSTLADRVENANLYQNADRRVYEERWRKPGDVTMFKDVKDTSRTRQTSRFVQDNDYISCESISLGYDITSPKVLNFIGAERLRVTGTSRRRYAAGQQSSRNADWTIRLLADMHSHSMSHSNTPTTMKTINICTCVLAGLLTLLITSSCEDWFDVDPRTEIKENDLFKDESGYFDALVGVYSIMGRQALYGDELTMGSVDAISQIYYIGYGTAHPLYYMSTFEYDNTRVRPVIDAMWSNMYEAIANVNNLLAHIDNADPGMFESNNYQLIKGEALALRAYLHFDILRLFGPSFRMDKDRKCIPYVTTVSKDNTPYSSPEEIVGLCLRDLEDAATLLAEDPVTEIIQNEDNIYRMNRTTRMNLYAVQALSARICHYAGDKTNALRYAGMLIGNEKLTLISTTMSVRNDRVISSELLFALFVDNLSDWTDDHFRHSSHGYDYYQMQFYMDEFYDRNAGVGSDIRYDAQFDVEGSNMKLSKYLSKDGDNYSAKYRVPMLRLSEMYYIAAESTDNIEEASDLLNRVRRARALEPMTFADFSAVESYLTREYRREFYGEGQLFYRYKWLNADNIADGYLIKNISSRKEEVYILPLPDQEKEFGGTANQ